MKKPKNKIIAPVYWVDPDRSKERISSKITILLDPFNKSKGQLKDGRPVYFRDDEWLYYFKPEMTDPKPAEPPLKDDFNQWFATFIEEKGLSNLVIEFENQYGWNHMPIEVIQEYLMFCNEEVQEKVRKKLVQIDFCNQNINHFLRYIAKGIGHNE